MNEEFVGHLTTFERKDETEIVDVNVLIEVTDLQEDGRVEIAFNDRNERCYLKFSLADLVAHAALVVGTKVC